MKEEKSVFSKLNAIDVNEHTKEKNGLTYLSWAWGWQACKRECPDATYTVWRDEKGLPYIYDPNLGYMVFTTVTIKGETLPMWLFVMDGANKAMKAEPYTYEVAEWVNHRRTGKMIKKSVAAATMFDINTAIMRCFAKNIAMHGIGLYIFAGEDIPEATDEVKAIEKAAMEKAQAEITDKAIKGLSSVKAAQMKKYWSDQPLDIRNNVAFLQGFKEMCVSFMDKCTIPKHMTDLWKLFPKEIGDDKAFAEEWKSILSKLMAKSNNQVKSTESKPVKPEESKKVTKPVTKPVKAVVKPKAEKPAVKLETKLAPKDASEEKEEATEKLLEMTIVDNNKAKTPEALVGVWNNSLMFHEDNDYYAVYLDKAIGFVELTKAMEELIKLWDLFSASLGRDTDFRAAFSVKRKSFSK